MIYVLTNQFPQVILVKRFIMKLELTEKEAELIVSALLFTASGDACIDIKPAQEKILVEIAKKIGVKEVNTAYIYGEARFFERQKITKSILKNFNIRREGI